MPRRTRQELQFVGREAELALLRGEFTSAIAGEGSLAFLHGEPGIGKTTLARTFAREAGHRGATVLWGRGYDGEWLPPYTPWLEAASGAPNLDLSKTFDDFLHRDGQGQRSGETAQLLDPDEARFKLHEAVVRRLREATGKAALVIILDDMQWMDRGSIELVQHIGHFGLDMPLLLLATYRDTDLAATLPLSQALAKFQRSQRATFIGLSGFHSPDVTQLLESNGVSGVSDEAAGRIIEATAGNPLFVSELIEFWREQSEDGIEIELEEMRFGRVPGGVGAVVNSRFDRLSPTAIWVLRQIAIFPSGFDFALLPPLTGLSETELLDTVDELLAARLIEARPEKGPERYDIVHSIVRMALIEPLSPSRRVRLERAAAEAMERAYGAGVDVRAAELAIQYGRSASLPGAEAGLRYALIAAERAQRGFDRAKTVFYLEIARDLVAQSAPDVRASVLCQLAIAQADVIEIEDAAMTADSAINALELSNADPGTIAAFYADLVTSLKQHASAEAQVWRPLLTAGLAVASQNRDHQWARLMLLKDPVQPVSRDEIVAGRWMGFDPDAVAIARESEDERAAARSVESFDYRNRQETDDYLRLVRNWSEPAAIMYGLTVVGNDLQYRHGAFRAAELIWDEISGIAKRHGAINWQAQATNQLTILHLARGRFAEARDNEARAKALLDQLGQGRRSHVLELEMATAFAIELGGDWSALAEQWLAIVSDRSLDAHDPATLMNVHYAALAAYCFAEAGDLAGASSMIRALTPILESLSAFDPNQNGAVAFAAAAVWRMQLSDFASRYLDLAQSLEAHDLGDYPQTSIALTLARMAALAGQQEEARQHFARARSMLDESGQRPLRAIVDLDEAASSPDVDTADMAAERDALVKNALASFEQLGMSEWQIRAKELSGRVDAPVSPIGELPAGLSEREAEVLRLVARGLSDRQISDQLFVSPRTINSHIRNMLNKTGAVNRTELSVWAVEQGLTAQEG
jgi:DNA-binding CsgD family transcriptional regulator